MEPELSNDLMSDGLRRYDHCNRCNYDMHDCPGCGEYLSHNGLQRLKDGSWAKHEGCTD